MNLVTYVDFGYLSVISFGPFGIVFWSKDDNHRGSYVAREDAIFRMLKLKSAANKPYLMPFVNAVMKDSSVSTGVNEHHHQ